MIKGLQPVVAQIVSSLFVLLCFVLFFIGRFWFRSFRVQRSVASVAQLFSIPTETG